MPMWCCDVVWCGEVKCMNDLTEGFLFFALMFAHTKEKKKKEKTARQYRATFAQFTVQLFVIEVGFWLSGLAGSPIFSLLL